MTYRLDLARIKTEWFSNVRGDLLSGLVVALALIPEAIGFSIVAGVDPKVGLYASFSIAVVTAFVGGRPAMISGATAAMALLMITLVRDHGLEYLFAATVVTGLIQVLFGIAKLGRYMRFVPKSVMIGFVNALAIMIFLAQLEHFQGAGLGVVALVLAGLAIIYLFPRLTRLVPSPLVAIVVLTTFAVFSGIAFRTVGDMGELPSALPFFGLPLVPFTLETLLIVLPYAFPLALVGLIESLLTANIVDDLTDTPSDKNREARGQGIANVVTGFFGGMAGCAMIGQSIINVGSGGRTRLSTLMGGVLLMAMILLLGDVVRLIPIGALVAVMVMVSINTFDWGSLPGMLRHPKSDTIVMLSTVGVVLWTHNLALGVGVGVVLSALFFSRKIANLIEVTSTLDESGRTRTYSIVGQLFFVSTEAFQASFEVNEDLDDVVIDLAQAQLWDGSAVDAIDKVVMRFRGRDTRVTLRGVNATGAALMENLAVHDRPGTRLGER
ncbi:MAG: SulP family inorganic anion transporter [Trueperaceae bacterium]|nr:SulP family inorganic anion transporter [Trueperaceae bacterium]